MPRANAYHILVKTKEEVEKLKQRLAKSSNFQQLIQKHSICPSRKRRGSLGEFNREDMMKAFDDVVFKKALFELHGPVKTRFGFHLVKTVDRS
jgi:peptidyl-prolyl cis-trans isomerase C